MTIRCQTPYRHRILPFALSTVLALALPPAAQSDPADAMLARGREALAAGDRPAACEHLRRALVRRPDSTEVLALLVEASRDDGGAQALWAQAWLAAAADARGRADLPRAAAAALDAAAPEARALAVARAGAVSELASFARARRKRARNDAAQALVAWWAAGAGLELARPSPALRAACAGDLTLAFDLPPKLRARVESALKSVMNGALSGGRAGEAVRAARILHGLGTQAGFEDLQGEAPPGAPALRALASEALARARTMLARGQGEPLTLEQLEALDQPAQRAFTRAHADFADPGLGVSPGGLYRVETVCGYETLLGVVATVEDHHRRLCGWYGTDPFVGRPGLVRVAPEAAGLEQEGTPFWWAGGFQSGDLTVLRFSCGTVEGLGHGLTHELTHRFDGALYPGLPAWLAEGRAVRTGGAFGHSSDERFVLEHVSFGTVEAAFIKGYGAQHRLEELLAGTIDDYRDNYVAGYALYVYLDTWEEGGRRPFAAELGRYMSDTRRGSADPVAFFAAHFADARAGRPQGMEAFAQGFATFLQGFYWDSRAEWTARYLGDVPSSGSPWVYDGPTWTWSRARAEPAYGQDQARRAGRLLLDLGQRREAADALLWSLEVDERSPWFDQELAALLEELGDGGPAWTLRNEIERARRRPGDAGGAPAPFLRELSRTRALLEALSAAARASEERGAALAAAALTADHDALAARLGLPLSAAADGAAPPASAFHPLDQPARLIAPGEWREDGLTGYEERRVPGLWYAEEAGDLHVGRARPRTGTGDLDRAAHQRHAFARAGEWQQAGRYRVQARIRFTTSYVSGALVLGYGRRDRNVRVEFSAGDFMYSIGKKDETEDIAHVGWSVHGLRERDGALPGALCGGGVDFPEPRPHFELELIVDGAAVHVWIEGEHVGTWHAPDGQPIEGYVGFATSNGAIRVIEPTVQRLDRSRALGRDLGLGGLDLARPPEVSFKALVNRTVRGLSPSTRGSLLVWLPLDDLEREGAAPDVEAVRSRAQKYAARAAALLEREGATQPIVLALPDAIGREALAAIAAGLVEAHGARVSVAPYRSRAVVHDPDESSPASQRTWLCFVDSAGVLRVAARFFAFTDTLPEGLAHWLAVFR